MAVYKLEDKPRNKPWVADWYEGPNRRKKCFPTKTEAENCYNAAFASQNNKGLPLLIKQYENETVRVLVERYKEEITPTKRGAAYEAYRLDFILNNEPGKTLCNKTLLVSKPDAWSYIRARQKQTSNRGTPITMRTISRERNLLQDVFRVAIEEWGYVGLTNIFAGLKLKGSKFKRTRRLEEGEYLTLLKSVYATSEPHNQTFIPLAIDIAIETAMREEEIFDLQWRDLDFKNRIITIRESKTDEHQTVAGRRIALPIRTLVDLVCLMADNERDGVKVKKTDRIFPMTQSALMQAFERARDRTDIEDLQFRDLRHEACSRWDDTEPPLTRTQIKTMMGHISSSNDITDTYSNSNIKKIREGLDKQAMGVEFVERHNALLGNGDALVDIIKSWPGGMPVMKAELSSFMDAVKDASRKAEALFVDANETKQTEKSDNIIPFPMAK